MLLVAHLGAECLQRARLGRVVSSRERSLETGRDGAVVLLLEHLRADVVMDILRTDDQVVLSPKHGGAMTELERASRGRRVGEGARVVGNEANVELFSMQYASKAIEIESKTGPQFLAQIEGPEVRAGAEEVPPGEVQRAVLSQQTQGKRAGLFDAVISVQE